MQEGGHLVGCPDVEPAAGLGVVLCRGAGVPDLGGPRRAGEVGQDEVAALSAESLLEVGGALGRLVVVQGLQAAGDDDGDGAGGRWSRRAGSSRVAARSTSEPGRVMAVGPVAWALGVGEGDGVVLDVDDAAAGVRQAGGLAGQWVGGTALGAGAGTAPRRCRRAGGWR